MATRMVFPANNDSADKMSQFQRKARNERAANVITASVVVIWIVVAVVFASAYVITKIALPIWPA